MSDQEKPIHKKEILTYGDLIAFYLPILLLGGLVVMPIIYSVLSNYGLLGKELSELITSYSPGNLFILSIASLIPSMIAYGRDLQFNLWRYFIGIAIIVILGLRSYAQLKGSVSLPLPIGGGIIGILIASTLGWAGLRLKKRYSLKKIGWYILLCLAFFIGIIIIGSVFSAYIGTRVWDIETVVKWAPTWESVFTEKADVRGTGKVVGVDNGEHNTQRITIKINSGPNVLTFISRSIQIFRERGKPDRVVHYPECEVSLMKIGDLVRFEGRYYSREYISKFPDWFPRVSLTEEMGYVDSSPCDWSMKLRDFGSLIKINENNSSQSE